MSEHSFDFIVIGGGSGGYAAARDCSQRRPPCCSDHGASELGGLCILRGCTAQQDAHRIRQPPASHPPRSGVRPKPLPHGVDVRTIVIAKRTLIADFASYRQDQLEDGRFALYRGHARFVDAHTVEVLPRHGSASFQASARTFCIATGSEVMVPHVPGLAETGYWTSDDVLDADTLPKTIAVLAIRN